MPSAQRRALVFFASCVVVSMALTAADLAGARAPILRIAAVFSLVVGIIVLLVRGRTPR